MFSSRNSIIRKTSSLLMKVPCCRVHLQSGIIRLDDPLPQCELYEGFPTNVIKMPDLVIRRNIVLFAVPGAFTPGCSRTHLPGYLRLADDMKNDGIDEIVCVSVNDPYVMGAWGEKHKTKGKIRMLADPDGSFISALGLGMRIPTLGGYRSKRFSMVVIDNSVKALNVEPDGTGLSCSLASECLYKNYIKRYDDQVL